MTRDAVAIYGVHGDEKSPVRLLDWLQTKNIAVEGPLNKKAWWKDKRCVDHDLNRVFGKDKAGYEERLKQSIIDLVKPYDTIIDLHSFRMQGEPMLIKLNDQDLPEADHVWDVRTSDISGTMCGYFAQQGKKCFPVELPDQEVLRKKHVEDAKRIIRDVIQNKVRDYADAVARTVIEAPFQGTFIPRRDVGVRVDEGDVLGIVAADRSERIHAPHNGRIGQIQLQRDIQRGESLCGLETSIG